MPTIKGLPVVRKIDSTRQVSGRNAAVKSEFFGAINNVEPFQWGSQFQKEIVGRRIEFFSEHGVFESIKDGKYLVKFGLGYVQTESGPFILDLGGIVNRAMTGAKAGGAVEFVK